jgi:type 1 glutamine amidotransferase
MRMRGRALAVVASSWVAVCGGGAPGPAAEGVGAPVPRRVLLYHYNSTPVAATTPQQIAFLKNQLAAWGYEVEVSEEPSDINAARLRTLSAVGFINVCFNPYGRGQTGEAQTAALAAFVEAGGGMFVTHCSSVAFQNASPPNPYADLIGGRSGRDNFDGASSCTTTPERHVSTAMLPATFRYSGNLDNADYLSPDAKVLVRCMWSGGKQLDTAVSWYRTPGKGRVFYTNFAKVDSDYSSATIGAAHIVSGLGWAVGR